MDHKFSNNLILSHLNKPQISHPIFYPSHIFIYLTNENLFVKGFDKITHMRKIVKAKN